MVATDFYINILSKPYFKVMYFNKFILLHFATLRQKIQFSDLTFIKRHFFHERIIIKENNFWKVHRFGVIRLANLEQDKREAWERDLNTYWTFTLEDE